MATGQAPPSQTVSQTTSTPTPSPRSVISQSLTPPAFPQKRVDDALIEFPLAQGQERFRSIDGKKMHTYVVKLAEIARKYRDTVNPNSGAASPAPPPTMRPPNGWPASTRNSA